jgi:hypothetical protein
MQLILSILLISSICITQEMEVQGDLRITGSVQSTTIDSLQNQINSLLIIINQLEQRIAQLECQNTGIIPDGYCDCFFNTLDECGVCDGDTTSCQDCAGVPNGDAELDICGVCNGAGEGSCIQINLINNSFIYISNTPFFGFRIDHDGCVADVSSDLIDGFQGWSLISNETFISGFSFTNIAVEGGSGVLLEFEGDCSYESFSNIEFFGFDEDSGLTLPLTVTYLP